MVEEDEGFRFHVIDRPIDPPHFQTYCNQNVISDLKEKLTTDQFEKFKNTCFGVYTRMHQFWVQNQIIKCLMVHELVKSSPEALLFRKNNNTIKFTIREFAIISGLNCVSDAKDFTFNKKEPNRIIDRYFNGVHMTISKAELITNFDNKVWGEGNDEDAVKFAILYLMRYSQDIQPNLMYQLIQLNHDCIQVASHSPSMNVSPVSK